MKIFLEKYQVISPDEMYGRMVYVSMLPEDGKPIYKGELLGYGTYGHNPLHKTFCVQVYRGDGKRFIDYFTDECFKSADEYATYQEQYLIVKNKQFVLWHILKLGSLMEPHIPVMIKVNDMLYPVSRRLELPEKEHDPAFVLEVDTSRGQKWE